jgi:hypothetical protein
MIGNRLLIVKWKLFFYFKKKDGVWPSWLRRLVWDQEIGGSNPLTPTILKRKAG